MSEQVNHPSRYNQEGRKECIDELADKYGVNHTILWCIMTAEKYMYRAGAKDGNSEHQDLKKAWWYIDWARKLMNMHHQHGLKPTIIRLLISFLKPFRTTMIVIRASMNIIRKETNNMQVLYLCDQKQMCGARCTRDKNYECRHTLDPAHAKNGPCEDPAKHPERFIHTEICDCVDLYTEKSQE